MSQSIQSPACHLDLLPNELLLLISDCLDDDALLQLASTCMRANYLLTPVLFTRCNFDPPVSPTGSIDSITFTSNRLVSLQALAIAYFVNSINSISCDMSGTLPKDFLRALTALKVLNGRLSHLGHVYLNPYFSGYRDKLAVVECVQAVAAFLNTAARRKDCAITLFGNDHDSAGLRPFSHTIRSTSRHHTGTVESTGSDKHRTQHAVPNDVPRAFFIGRRLLRTIAGAFMSWYPSSRKTASAPQVPAEIVMESKERLSPHTLPLVRRPAFTTLNVHSSYLLHATFYKWTLHLLNTAPLTALSLDNIDLLHYDWHLVLPALTLPALAVLKIGQCDIAVCDLTLFLARHPFIRTLDLSFHVARGPLFPPAAASESAPHLPRLECLRAMPDYVLYFLSPADTGTDADMPGDPDAGYPDLRTVSITHDHNSPYQVAQVERAVACIEARSFPPVVDVLSRFQMLSKLAQSMSNA
ncbi:hypothetical protein GGX14DRAFT_467870 [Mycena pura]|uniref:F-box domain-containing protein n=1 Tax=Mycena pura TaxID=153505 RepID=A0AAD6V432_9AGAR|nr:hypothetical protein GGX14DRAFT_467870 [Mycena pura]